jgi:hypothetical protein
MVERSWGRSVVKCTVRVRAGSCATEVETGAVPGLSQIARMVRTESALTLHTGRAAEAWGLDERPIGQDASDTQS